MQARRSQAATTAAPAPILLRSWDLRVSTQGAEGLVSPGRPTPIHRATTMRLALSLGAIILAAAPVCAQREVDTVGGTTSTPSSANRGKAGVYSVTQSSILLEFEMYLDVPGVETLTYFVYKYHQRSGTFVLDVLITLNVDGTGVGPAWYSTGPIAYELLCGNHYMIGMHWVGYVQYFYDLQSTPEAISMGTWERAHTISGSIPPTYTVRAGVDTAQYHQRLTTAPNPTIDCIGQPCGNSVNAPTLVATSPLRRGQQMSLEIYGAAANSPAYYLFATAALPAPIPLLGCGYHLDPSSFVELCGPLQTSATGELSLPIAIGNDPALAGFPLSVQGVVVADLANAVLDFTGAVSTVVN